MSDAIEILIAKYPNTTKAESALKKLQAARGNQGIEIHDAAVVSRQDNGKLHIHETEDVTSRHGAAVGGILGGVLGIIAGPAGVVAGAAMGAAVGGAAARVIDTGIPHERLEAIGAGLEQNRAALVIVTDAGFVPFIETVIQSEDVEFLTETMDAQAAHELGRAHDVALKALKMGEALADGGMASPTKAE